MSAIQITEGLWLGDNEAARDPNWRERHGIEAIASVLRDDCEIGEVGIYHLRVIAPDGPGFEFTAMKIAVQFLAATHLELGLTTLLHCWGGTSRSVSVAAAYLYLYPGARVGQIAEFADPEGAAKRLRELRGVGLNLPHPEVWKMAVRCMDEMPQVPA